MKKKTVAKQEPVVDAKNGKAAKKKGVKKPVADVMAATAAAPGDGGSS